MKNRSGESALAIDPSWMERASELQGIQGVVTVAGYVHHSNMNIFPKRLNESDKPIHCGLPVTLETENSLLGLLGVLYPAPGAGRAINTTTAFAREKPLKESRSISHSELLDWFEQYTGKELTWGQLQQAPSTVVI